MPWTFVLLLLCALWIATRRYQGIYHDGRLYVVQALQRLDPALFPDDLFFAFGSQDAFTLFSLPYALLVQAVGPSGAHALAVAVGHLGWFAAMLLLLRSVFGASAAMAFAAAGVILLDPFYGNLRVFSYAESFATPRLFAEALVMVALGAALRDRLWLAGTMLVPAAAIHPLMTLPGAAIIALLAALKDRRLWLVYAAGAAMGIGLAMAGIEPFARAVLRFDQAWFETVYVRCAFAFVTQVDLDSILTLAPTVAALAMTWRLGTPRERRLLVLLVVTALGGVVATLVGGDLGRNVLVVNLQPWRALWLLALMGNAWAAVLLLRLPAGSDARRLFALALACNALQTWCRLPPLAAWLPAYVAWAAFTWQGQTARPLPRAARWLAWVAAGARALPLVAGFAFVLVMRGNVVGIALGAGAALAAGLLLLTTVLGPRRRPSWAAWGLSAMALAGAVAAVDGRTRWQRFLEDDSIPDDVAGFIADARAVYWEDGVDLLWLKLRMPSHYSCLQGAGVMFYSGTAAEYRRRGEALAVLGTVDFEDPAGTMCAIGLPRGPVGAATPADLAQACRALPELDAIVLRRPVPGLRATAWHPPVPQLVFNNQLRLTTIDAFHLYRCADLRQPGEPS